MQASGASFGQTVWSSGQVLFPPPADDPSPSVDLSIDIALVKVNDTKICHNRLPPSQRATWRYEEEATDTGEYSWGFNGRISPLHKWTKTRWGLVEDLPVIKYGRSSRVTEARLGSSRLLTLREGVICGDHYTWASKIGPRTSRNRRNRTVRYFPFSEQYCTPGDAGAPVICYNFADTFESLIGMHLGGNKENAVEKATTTKKGQCDNNHCKHKDCAHAKKLRIGSRDIGVLVRWDTIQRAVETLTPWKVRWASWESEEGLSGEMYDRKYASLTEKEKEWYLSGDFAWLKDSATAP